MQLVEKLFDLLCQCLAKLDRKKGDTHLKYIRPRVQVVLRMSFELLRMRICASHGSMRERVVVQELVG